MAASAKVVNTDRLVWYLSRRNPVKQPVVLRAAVNGQGVVAESRSSRNFLKAGY